MPSAPPIHRPKGYRSRREANREVDRTRWAKTPTRRLYGLARWRKIKKAQLAAEANCRMCWERDRRAVEANTCDHVEPHGGDVEKFWAGPFQSLCGPCHNGRKQAEERAGRWG